MGREHNVTCVTCKKHFNCGTQSYSNWLRADSIKEWHQEAEKHPDLAQSSPNINLRDVLIAHDGHELIQWWNDFCDLDEDEKLWTEGGWGSRELLADCVDFVIQHRLRKNIKCRMRKESVRLENELEQIKKDEK